MSGVVDNSLKRRTWREWSLYVAGTHSRAEFEKALVLGQFDLDAVCPWTMAQGTEILCRMEKQARERDAREHAALASANQAMLPDSNEDANQAHIERSERVTEASSSSSSSGNARVVVGLE